MAGYSWRQAAWIAPLGWALLSAWACVPAAAYHCSSNAQCQSSAGAQGICETNGTCSFPDSTCTGSQRRYAADPKTGAAGSCIVARPSCIAQMSGGSEHFCALKSDGTVWCWGANESGELGNGTTTDSATPVKVTIPGGKQVHQVGTSEHNSCALATDGTMYCWGINEHGQLGTTSGSNPGPDSPTPVLVPVPESVTEISIGGEHACALGASGNVYCWGENNEGQAGNASLTDVISPALVPVKGASGNTLTISHISSGDEHSAALSNDGTVWGWGGNESGELGNGSYTGSATPVQALGLTSISAIASGDEHVCVAKNGGDILCWGENEAGAVGNGTVSTSAGTSPNQPVNVFHGSASLVAGCASFNTCSIKTDASLYCWGANDTGQMGTGTLAVADYPSPTPVLLPAASLVAISTHDICAVSLDGLLWCWGANDHGQLASGTSGAPQPVPQRTGFTCP